MAKTDATGIPEVTPQAGVPDDYEHEQASPAAFGAEVGQGEEALGQGVSQVGKFWGQIQTDGSINDTNGAATQLVEKFKGLQGSDAMNGQAEYEEQLKDLYAGARQNLKTSEQKLNFDNQTRSFYQRFLQPQVYSHANQQALVHASDVNNNGIKQYYDALAALDPKDPDYGAKADDAIHGAVGFAVKNAHLRLGDSATDEDVSAFVRPVLQNALKTQAQVMAQSDPEAAVKFLDEHRETIGVDYPALSAQFRTRANTERGLSVADQAFTATAQNMANPTGPMANVPAIREALLQQESGNRGPNPGQVQPGTFAQYAKPGESLDNPNDARAVSARIVDDLAKKYDGDPQRIAVGYFSGPGNVAPPGSATPWLVDAKDANGKSTSSYVADITNRLGSQGPMLAAKAGVYDKVLAATEGHPEVRQIALKEVNERYTAAQTADLQTQVARKAALDQAFRQVGDAIHANPTAPIEPLLQKFPQFSQQQAEDLRNVHAKALQESLDGSASDWGPAGADVDRRIRSNGADRIINQEQLVPFAKQGGGLTNAGYTALSKKLDEFNKPNAQGDRDMEANFKKSAEKMVTLESEVIPGLKRKGGMDQWNRALPVIEKAITDGRAAGLSAQELFDPDNKKSVWTAIKPYLPTEQEKKNAGMVDAVEKDRQAVAARPIDLNDIKTEAQALEAWNGGRLKRGQLEVVVSRHPEWGIELPGGPAVPLGGAP